MTVRVLLYAGARALAGCDAVRVALPEGATYRLLAERLAEAEPALGPLVARSRFAADDRYASPEEPVDPRAEVALIPPVSGG